VFPTLSSQFHLRHTERQSELDGARNFGAKYMH
jgi:hypothetical protein